jgi:hypothetical protein
MKGSWLGTLALILGARISLIAKTIEVNPRMAFFEIQR